VTVKRWAVRGGSLAAAAGAGLAGRSELSASQFFKRLSIAALALVAIFLASRLHRMLRVPIPATYGLALLLLALVSLGAAAGVVDLDRGSTMMPWVLFTGGTYLVFVYTKTDHRLWGGRTLVLFLESEPVRPVTYLVDMRVWSVFSIASVDLSDSDITPSGGFIVVSAVGSKLNLVFDEDARDHVVEIDAMTRRQAGKMQVMIRRYLGSPPVELQYLVPDQSDDGAAGALAY